MFDPAGFRSFYQREFPAQVRRAGLILGRRDLAADVVQEAFVSVWTRWDDLDDPAPYLSRSVMNGCRSAARREGAGVRARRKLEPLGAPVEDPDPLWDALGALDFQQRAPLVLRYYARMTNPEIASTLGWPTGSVGPRITKGLRALRKALS